FIIGEPGIGELERVNANGGVRMADERLHVGGRERAELFERVQREDGGGWLGDVVGKQFAESFRRFLKRIGTTSSPLNRPSGTFTPSGGEGWDEGVFSAFDEQTLRGLPPPEKRAGTFAGERL